MKYFLIVVMVLMLVSGCAWLDKKMEDLNFTPENLETISDAAEGGGQFLPGALGLGVTLSGWLLGVIATAWQQYRKNATEREWYRVVKSLTDGIESGMASLPKEEIQKLIDALKKKQEAAGTLEAVNAVRNGG